MENFIYILIGVAWVAYSLYSARQKAIQKQQRSGFPPSGPSQSSPLPIPGNQGGGKTLFEDIFRELSGEPRPVQHAPQPVMPAIPDRPKNIPEFKVSSEFNSRYEFISSVPPQFSPGETKKESKIYANEEQLTKNDRIVRKFNLREAVIFSELLNHKYF